MSFAQDNGYTPVSFETIMGFVKDGVNAQFGTTYDDVSFVGTNWYKYAYALVQRIQNGEVKTSEIFQQLQAYIQLTNQRIQRPSVSYPGLIDSFQNNVPPYIASVKPPLLADAGKVFICVNLDSGADDYGAQKLAVCTLVKDFIAAGIQSQGTEVETLTLSNGQSFDFKFYLPNFIPVVFRLTATVSLNNLLTIPSDEQVREAVFANINSRYRLGWNFEPERYYGVSDALWASTILLEWSSNGGSTYHSTVYTADYKDLFTFALSDINVVFA